MGIAKIDSNFKTKEDIKNELRDKVFLDKEALIHDLDLINHIKQRRLRGTLLENDITYIRGMINRNQRTKKVINTIINILYLKYLLSFSSDLCAEYIYDEIKEGNDNIRVYDIQRINNTYIRKN